MILNGVNVDVNNNIYAKKDKNWNQIFFIKKRKNNKKVLNVMGNIVVYILVPLVIIVQFISYNYFRDKEIKENGIIVNKYIDEIEEGNKKYDLKNAENNNIYILMVEGNFNNITYIKKYILSKEDWDFADFDMRYKEVLMFIKNNKIKRKV